MVIKKLVAHKRFWGNKRPTKYRSTKLKIDLISHENAVFIWKIGRRRCPRRFERFPNSKGLQGVQSFFYSTSVAFDDLVTLFLGTVIYDRRVLRLMNGVVLWCDFCTICPKYEFYWCKYVSTGWGNWVQLINPSITMFLVRILCFKILEKIKIICSCLFQIFHFHFIGSFLFYVRLQITNLHYI